MHSKFCFLNVIGLLVLLLASSIVGQGAKARDSLYISKQFAQVAKVVEDDSAIGLYQKLKFQSQEIGYSSGELEALKMICQRYCMKGDYQEAISLARQGISLAGKNGNHYNDFVYLYNILGNAYSSTGTYDSALSSYLYAIALQRMFPSENPKALIYLNLAVLYNAMEQYDNAIISNKLALAILLKEENPAMLGTVYHNLGTTYALINGDKSKVLAEKFMYKAMDIARKNHLIPLERACLIVLGDISRKNKMLLKALDYYEKAMQMPIIDQYQNGQPIINIGNIYFQLGEFEKSKNILEGGLKQAKAMTPPPDYLYSFYLELANVYQATKNHEKAANYYKRYIELSENLKSKEQAKRVSELQLGFETAKRDNQLIKNELMIIKQNAIIQRNKIIAYLVISASILLGIILYGYYRFHRRKQKQKEEKNLWKASMQGEEKERGRIARELHDHIGGSLSNATMWFASIEKKHSVLQEDKEYPGAIKLLEDTLNEVRNTAHNLMPELVLRHGLAEAVKLHCEKVQKASGIKIKYHYLGYIGSMESGLQLILYRSIQELIQNVIKHAQAKQVLVQLSCHGTIISVTIDDKGIGMDPEAIEAKGKGMGLQNIKRSIHNMGGQFNIQTIKAVGTCVTFEIDIKDQMIKSDQHEHKNSNR